MKKILVLNLFAVFLVLLAGCAPGSSLQVTTTDSTIQLSVPGPNPTVNQPDAGGRVAGAGVGLWHGIIAPVTLVMSFFSQDVRMYEVHNAGSEYDLGYLLGVTLVIVLISLIARLRRR
jgi:hypothetical protein